MNQGLKRLEVVFNSTYGNDVRIVDMIMHEWNEEYIWAAFCRNMRWDGSWDGTFSIDYMKHFWEVTSVREIPLCEGCVMGHENQLGHTGIDGCQSQDKSEPIGIDMLNEMRVILHSDGSGC